MGNVTPIDEEYLFEGRIIISQTDNNGIITYANREFCKTSGYSIDELIGQPHNLIRHPDMPSDVFEKMWNSISTGHTWNGLIKNLRKDGRYYWVDTEILPIEDKDKKNIGFIAARKAASRKNIEEAKENYEKMFEEQQ